jgi:hypothetical protein
MINKGKTTIEELCRSLGDVVRLYLGDDPTAHELMAASGAFTEALQSKREAKANVTLPLVKITDRFDRATRTQKDGGHISADQAIFLEISASGLSMELDRNVHRGIYRLNNNSLRVELNENGDMVATARRDGRRRDFVFARSAL